MESKNINKASKILLILIILFFILSGLILSIISFLPINNLKEIFGFFAKDGIADIFKSSILSRVKILYKSLLNREPDNQGYNGWLDNLKNGKSREYVLSGFINSNEFGDFCQLYDILPINLN